MRNRINSRMGRGVALALATILMSCGSHQAPFAKVEGMALGRAFEAKSMAFAEVDLQALPNLQPLGVASLAAVVLADSPNVCGEAQARSLRANQQYLFFLFVGRPLQVVAPGSFAVVDPGRADPASLTQALADGAAAALLWRGGEDCENSLASGEGMARSGRATLDAIDLAAGGQASGSFALDIGPQDDQLSGSFLADYCAPLGELLNDKAAALLQGEAAALPCNKG
ncbi:MAG: hypothetical protein EOO40_09220 [Deltaproteobacteria bacterium]|nr:MAG: hypothetical protein EOO40_09220 [Deltaproteobacteria bacterium]